ncbi:integrase catalytic domain-containing protein [Trichonephila clavata]|uniref:Integrase catalytic domain-containing protein n=1 Tax=Trichonephila clavata TaxID=2740835 RepID=A0A8X6KTL9_TRICU|nr:integrase catalytic domain-containing protein [Trichonephila clavata]
MSSVLNPQYSPENYATLPQTAEVQVINVCNKVIARLLFDSGSQKSFIRNDLKNALNLKPVRQETLLIYTFSNRKPLEKTFEVVNLTNEISEIQEYTDPVSWRHCSGKQNPADLLTRGITRRELINSEKWWNGPEWLKDSENLWPNLEGFESIDSETVELKSSLIVNLTITREKIIDPDKYSSLLKLPRVTAYIFRFVNVLRRKDFEKGPLASEDLFNAEIFWVKVTQNGFFSSEITCLKSDKPLQKDSKLLCLNPFLDDNGVLRVTGRLEKLLLYQRMRNILLFSLPNLGNQVIAPLPDVCVTESPPFSVVGIDFAGPLFVKDSNAKQYILLITCAVTRSVHLELVSNMTTDTFLLAFRRFIARRGLCSLNYIIERAAWWGGFYERMVRSVKVALRKTLGKSSLTTEQLSTVLTEIEGMINSQPITYVGSETEEPISLTPAHFIAGKRITSLPLVRLHLVCMCV